MRNAKLSIVDMRCNLYLRGCEILCMFDVSKSHNNNRHPGNNWSGYNKNHSTIIYRTWEVEADTHFLFFRKIP